MSNHSYPCCDGGEIGRAQVVQAEACGLEPELAMNPVLLKPNGDGTSQVIVHGRVWKTLPARGYYEHADFLRAEIDAAHASLARRFDVIVIEGAGSVTELNLRSVDLVNLPFATRIGAPWVLVSRHRARRRLRVRRRHVRAADAGRAEAVSRVSGEQVPRRSIALRRGRGAPGREDRRAVPGNLPVRDRRDAPRGRQSGRGRHATRAAAAGRAHRHPPVPEPLERHRLPLADVGGLAHGTSRRSTTTSSSCPGRSTWRAISPGCARRASIDG